MVSHPYPLGWIRNALGGPCGPSSFPALKRILGTDREPRVWAGSSHVLRSQKGEGQGPLRAGPLGARSRRGSEEPSTLSRHWPFYRAVTLLSVHVALTIRADRRPCSHKGRGDRMGAGRAGPSSQWPPKPITVSRTP